MYQPICFIFLPSAFTCYMHSMYLLLLYLYDIYSFMEHYKLLYICLWHLYSVPAAMLFSYLPTTMQTILCGAVPGGRRLGTRACIYLLKLSLLLPSASCSLFLTIPICTLHSVSACHACSLSYSPAFHVALAACPPPYLYYVSSASRTNWSAMPWWSDLLATLLLWCGCVFASWKTYW
jgi:hypothetical protein